MSGMLLTFAASAQPKAPEEIDPEAIAKHKTMKMDKDLRLTEKQYKKVYKLFLNIEKSRVSDFSGMRPPQGDMSAMGGRPGGMPPGGMMGGMPGGMPGGMAGGPPQNFGDGQMPGRPPMGMPDKTEEEKIEKKLRKILTEQQYDRWESLRSEEMMRKMMP